MNENFKNNMEKEHRKLAAIMFTDMVGYSSLAQQNESLALDLLKEHREILREIFPRHNGNEIETAGDAFFVEFESALEAANCAVEIQKILHERNKKTDPEKLIQLRIGLHVGDVVHIGKHVHGDGVNIASRLEPLAKPGGICLSEDVERQIHNKFNFPIKKMGKGKLKNIDLPVNVYSIVLPSNENIKHKIKRRKWQTLKNFGVIITIIILITAATLYILPLLNPDTPDNLNKRIAVLPFVNISKDTEEEYFADGMTEELISSLAKIGGLDVIARTSIMKYKGVRMDVTEIGNELDVGTILEGSIRIDRDKIRVIIQLIDAESQKHLWTQDYNKKLEDVFDIQTEIAERVADELKVQMLISEKEHLEKKGPENIEAYRFYLLGRYNLNKRSFEAIQGALKYFNQAIELQPDYALAYSGLADCYALISLGYGNMSPIEATKKSKESAIKALELDNQLAEAYASLAYIKFRFDWEWEEAEGLFRKAIELKPGYSVAHEWYGLFLLIQERFDEAMHHMRRAEELNPLSLSVQNGVGRVYEFSRQYDKAIDQFNKIIKTEPDYVEAHFSLSTCYLALDNYDKSIEELNKAMKLSGKRPIFKAALGFMYSITGKKKEAEQILKEFQDANSSLQYTTILYAGLGEIDKAINSLYESYERKESGLIYLKFIRFYDPLRNDSRFKNLVKEIWN